MRVNKIYKRKIYNELLKWKNESNGASALLIEGARRIGKTTVAEELGSKEFPSFLTIDFSIASPTIKEIFNNLSNIELFFERLFLALGTGPLKKGSLIIFDEVQFCPKARQAIKSLVKDRRYFYIETGSLVSIKENSSDILIPSEEESIQMYPMDFEEFLWANNLDYESTMIKEHFENRKPFDQATHNLIMQHFRTYMAIGGMPQAVECYKNTKDLYRVDKEKRKILKLYEEDLRKIDSKYGTICYLIWRQMPTMLTKHSTRFIVSSIDQRADSILFQNTMEKLTESKMVIPVFKCTDPSGGFALTKYITAFKLYFSDVGLFTSLIYPNTSADVQDIYQKLIFNKTRLNLGMLFENTAAQTLTANNFQPYYYTWQQENNSAVRMYEIDFIIYKNGKTIPFEVKSRNISQKESLDEFRRKFVKKIGEKYIVDIKNLSFGDNLTYLPFYMLNQVR